MSRWHMMDEVYEEKTYMGVEESVFPAIVYGRQSEFGEFYEFDDRPFVPVDMGRVQPFGTPYPGTKRNKDVLLFRRSCDSPVDARVLERVDLEKEYAFFYERSLTPLQTGYISRCRFVSGDKIKRWYKWGYVHLDRLAHETTVAEAMAEFIDIEIRFSIRYDIEFDELEYRCPCDVHADGYGLGFGFWVEQPGVYRLWSRALWVPK
jgi:hypothetical protein